MSMNNIEYEYTFDAITDVADRYGITMTEAEVFLVEAGYFDTNAYRRISRMFDPESPQ